MEALHSPKQTPIESPSHGNDDMNSNQAGATRSAPLYASPWLAFFYLIRRSFDQSQS